MRRWLREGPWWRWLVLVLALLFAVELLLQVTGTGSLDPTDPSNFPSQSGD